MEVIQVGIACGKRSEGYVNFLIQTMKKTESGKFDFEIIFGLSDSSFDINKVKSKSLYRYKIIEAFDDNISGSMGHGKCLDEIFKNMDTRIGMIVDVDVAFLSKNWDLKMFEELYDDRVMIGPEYMGEKYKGFPNVICCLFFVDKFKKEKISFKPSARINVVKEDEEFYGRKEGDVIHLDVGWETSYKLRKAGYTGVALPYGRRIDAKGEVYSKVEPKFIEENMRGEEYQLRGEPLFTHVGRSSSRDFHTNPIIKKWVDKVKKWIDL